MNSPTPEEVAAKLAAMNQAQSEFNHSDVDSAEEDRAAARVRAAAGWFSAHNIALDHQNDIYGLYVVVPTHPPQP